MRGRFITFEGGEGSGKTTIINKLERYFNGKKIDCVLTREPGGTEIAEKIRDVILGVNNKMDYRTEAQLYAASRTEHLFTKILPALENGKMVICDRYLDSSLVYQGIARGLGIDEVMNLNYYATKYLPDITFFIDICPEDAFARLADSHREMDRLDLESRDFHEMVYDGYKMLAKKYERIITINGKQTVEGVFNEIVYHLEKLMKE